MKPKTFGRIAALMGGVFLAAGGWWLSEERVTRLEAENSRLLGLLNEDRLIGTTRARSPVAKEFDDRVFEVAVTASTDFVPEQGEVLVSSEELDELESQLAEVLLPLEEESVATSMVNAAVRHGETLVTGGYRDENGNFVFTLATPKSTELGNGEEGIQFAFREFAVPAERVAELGLDSIASGARNTLQHGETWNSQEADAVIEKILADPEGIAMTAPTITALPGQQASVQIGEADRSRTISVNAAALPDASGFALRMRVEHRGIEGAVEGDSVSD